MNLFLVLNTSSSSRYLVFWVVVKINVILCYCLRGRPPHKMFQVCSAVNFMVSLSLPSPSTGVNSLDQLRGNPNCT